MTFAARFQYGRVDVHSRVDAHSHDDRRKRDSDRADSSWEQRRKPRGPECSDHERRQNGGKSTRPTECRDEGKRSQDDRQRPAHGKVALEHPLGRERNRVSARQLGSHSGTGRDGHRMLDVGHHGSRVLGRKRAADGLRHHETGATLVRNEGAPGRSMDPRSEIWTRLPRNLGKSKGIARQPGGSARVTGRRKQERARLLQASPHARRSERSGETRPGVRSGVKPGKRRVFRDPRSRSAIENASDRRRTAQRIGQGVGDGSNLIRVRAAYEHDGGLPPPGCAGPPCQRPGVARLGQQRGDVGRHPKA
jgi:hypothetical protein